MPAFKSKIICIKYMERIMNGEVYCPLYSIIRYKPCPRPPKKTVLLEMLLEVAAEDRLNLGIEGDKVPDPSWMLDVLATLRPDCYIFEKGYVPALIDREVPQDQHMQVDDSDRFWSGQPKLAMLGKSAKSSYSVMNRILGGSSIDNQIIRARERLEA